MLQITGRPARLGEHANLRSERHGDSDVMAVDLPLVFALSEDELDALLGEGVHDAWFVNGLDGKPAEPRVKGIEGIRLSAKLEGVAVTLTLGLARQVCSLPDCTLAKVTLTPSIGGLTECKVSVQAHPSPANLAAISAHLNSEAEVDLAFEAPKEEDEQEQLPLGDGS